jgi:hypothetical protein
MDPISTGIVVNVVSHYIIKFLDGSGRVVEVTWDYCGKPGCESCNLPKVCAKDKCKCNRPRVCTRANCDCDRRKMCSNLKCKCGRPKVYLG